LAARLLVVLAMAPIWPLTWAFATALALAFTSQLERFRADEGGVNRGARELSPSSLVGVRQHERVSEDRRYWALESAIGALLAAVSAQGGSLTAAAAAAAVPPTHLVATRAL
jgi:hypothetical protein